MATNYTTRSTGTPLPEKDRRAIAVSKKVQIGGKDGTIVSDDKVVTKDIFIDYDGKSTNVSQILKNIKPASSGIDIIGSDQTFTGATKIQFQGDDIFISKKEDGTIVITIGGVTIPKLTKITDSISETDMVTKHVFGPAVADAWQLPTTSTLGGAYDSCHPISIIPENVVIHLSGESGGDFGFENRETTLSIDLVCGSETINISSVLLDGNQTDGNGWDFVNPTKIKTGVKFDSITYTVSANTIKNVIGDGNTWKLVCTAGTQTVETTEKFAYDNTVTTPVFDDGAELIVQDSYVTTFAEGDSSCVSGIFYDPVKSPTGVIVTPISCSNTVNRVGAHETLRGKIIVSNEAGEELQSHEIHGATTDTEETKTSNEPQTFNLAESIAGGNTKFIVKQQMYGADDNNIETTAEYTVTQSSGSGYEFNADTYNTINFYTEDKGGDYNRVLARIVTYESDGYQQLSISSEKYDPTQTVVDNTDETIGDYYNCQAVVQDGKLIHPSKVNTALSDELSDTTLDIDTYTSDSTVPRYYVRKIVRNDPSDSSQSNWQSTLAKLNIKGFTELDGDDKEIWLYSSQPDLIDAGERLDSQYSSFGTTLVNDGIEFSLSGLDTNDQFEKTPLYILIKLNSVDAFVQGPIEFVTQK